MTELTYAFRNPIKSVNLEKDRVEYFKKPSFIVDGGNDYFNGTLVRSKNSADAFVEAGFLVEGGKKIRKWNNPEWWEFERKSTSTKIHDIEIVKEILDRMEIPENVERFFIVPYKPGERVDIFSVERNEGFENFVGGLGRQQTEVLARRISKEISLPCVVLTVQGFYDGTVKNGPLRKYIKTEEGTHLLEGFVRTEYGSPNHYVSFGTGRIDKDGSPVIVSGSASGKWHETPTIFENLALAPKREIELKKKEEIEKLNLDIIDVIGKGHDSTSFIVREREKLKI